MDELKDKTILIVDDENRNSFALGSYLALHAINLDTMGNGEEALTWLRSGEHVDSIRLDRMMPVMDGYETVSEVAKDEKMTKIPVISVAAKAMKGDKEKGLEAVAWDYNSNATDVNLLIEKLKRCMQ